MPGVYRHRAGSADRLEARQQQQQQFGDEPEEWEQRDFSNGAAVLQGLRDPIRTGEGAAGTSAYQQQRSRSRLRDRPISPRTGDFRDALPDGLEPARWQEVRATAVPQGDGDCPICTYGFTEPVKVRGKLLERLVVQLPCRHTFCEPCVRGCVAATEGPVSLWTCPTCRKPPAQEQQE